MQYRAPVDDMLATLRAVGALDDEDTARSILQEAGKMAEGAIAYTNKIGDRTPSRLGPDGVITADELKPAYAAIRDGGWLGLPFPEEHGGMGLPRVLGLVVMEMLQSANMSLALCPMLSLGAIEALIAHGTQEQQALYLPKIVSGEWTGTMNLTEPQAGSDVGALTTKAEPQRDGSYKITGQKIFITWGDHDLTNNIIHLVLARLPDGPPGSRGVSLFLCPKYLVDADGNPGERNAARCIRLEEKIGIHASPTCVMEYAGATGWIIGEPNKGLAAMFTMMNSARVNVGVQGVGVAEAASQQAMAYALERRQGQAEAVKGQAPLYFHPDIRVMLMRMRAKTLAARAICYACSAAADAAATGDENARLREDVLTPIAKAWATDVAVEVASLGVQVHGGLGFMNETSAAQFYRDARIAPIYEGTNGIQAMDLIGRKLGGPAAKAMLSLIDEVAATAASARNSGDAMLAKAADNLGRASNALQVATHAIMKGERRDALYAATRYLDFAGAVIGGHFLMRMALEGSNELKALAAFFAHDALGERFSFADQSLAGAAADRALG